MPVLQTILRDINQRKTIHKTGEMFTNNLSNKGFVSRIYKEFLKLNIKIIQESEQTFLQKKTHR